LFVRVKVLGVVALYSVGVTFVILKMLDKTLVLRLANEHEAMGMDLGQHSERDTTCPGRPRVAATGRALERWPTTAPSSRASS
jgi:hypothetical protein